MEGPYVEKNSFEELGLIKPLLEILQNHNHERPPPIQAQAIPALLAGKDILGVDDIICR